jgi:hypothetical protein
MCDFFVFPLSFFDLHITLQLLHQKSWQSTSRCIQYAGVPLPIPMRSVFPIIVSLFISVFSVANLLALNTSYDHPTHNGNVITN